MLTTVPTAPALLGLALRPLPLAPLQFALSAMLDAVVRRHPCLFDRLGAHAARRFGIDPTDMPFALALDPRPAAPRIAVLRRLPEGGLDARIAGPLAGLCGLAAGAFDGDALFFSRALAIEGDVEAILALRNALDDAEVDLLGAMESCAGPLGPVAGQAARIVAGVIALRPGGRQWS